MIKLDIISDVACPWCYVGKGFLDRALEARADHPFVIEWHPYQLNPELPPEGMSRDAFMAARFGSRADIVRVHEPLLARAEQAGVEFNLPAIQRTPNTMDAHRLIYWAGLEGRQNAVVSALFKAYWREGRDIGMAPVLVDIADKCGLDPAAIARLLDGPADRDEITQRMSHTRSRGVQAVPTYIIAQKHVVQGAQPFELWINVIDDINEQLRKLDK